MKKDSNRQNQENESIEQKQLNDQENFENKSFLHFSYEESTFNTPIPLPEMLAEYEKIETGMVNRIVTIIEKEQDFRIKSELQRFDLAKKVVLRGQFVAGLISTFGYLAGTWIALAGPAWVSGIVFGTTTTFLVGTFLGKDIKLMDVFKKKKDMETENS